VWLPAVEAGILKCANDVRGRSLNVSDSYRRLSDRSETVTVQLDAITHRFTAGSRIRVLVAGGCHPRYARNLGTGEAVATGQQLKPTSHEVHIGASRVVLPVPSSDDITDAGGGSA
jgi:predicted acyl esterase